MKVKIRPVLGGGGGGGAVMASSNAGGRVGDFALNFAFAGYPNP